MNVGGLWSGSEDQMLCVAVPRPLAPASRRPL